MTNPYAPPGFDDGGFVPPGGTTPGTPQPWEVGEVYKIGWEIIKREPILVVVVFGVYLVQNVPGIAMNILQALGLPEKEPVVFGIVTLVLSIAAVVFMIYLYVGQMKLFIAVARGQRADFSLLLSGADRILPMIGLGFLVSICFLLGALALCVGAVIVALAFTLAQYYLIDTSQGIIGSMRTSWRVTEGNRLKLFLFYLVGFVAMTVGMCALCVGYFVAWAVMNASLAVIYLRSKGENPTIDAPPPAAAPPPPAYSPQGMA